MLINQKDYDVAGLFSHSALAGRRRRRRSASPVNGEVAVTNNINAAVPTAPGARAVVGGPSSTAVQTIPSSAASTLSLNASGIPAGVDAGGGNLSSSLPPEEMGSKASVGSASTAEIQPGLYLSMRANYREQRIRQERIYMDVRRLPLTFDLILLGLYWPLAGLWRQEHVPDRVISGGLSNAIGEKSRFG